MCPQLQGSAFDTNTAVEEVNPGKCGICDTLLFSYDLQEDEDNVVQAKLNPQSTGYVCTDVTTCKALAASKFLESLPTGVRRVTRAKK